MNSKVKGLLKGLRYISQIFEPNAEEEEAEMQIGYPTDVKHVAHIGWDGPTNGTPSWMNEFRNAPLSSIGAEAMGETGHNDLNSSKNRRIVQGCPIRDSRKAIAESSTSHPLPEPPVKSSSRRHQALSSGSSSENVAGSQGRESTSKQTRRHKSSSEATGGAQGDQSENDGQSEGSHRRSRRQNRTKDHDGPPPSGIPRQTQKKKKKKKQPVGSSGEGSSRSSSNRPRGPSGYSDPDLRRPDTEPPLKTLDE